MVWLELKPDDLWVWLGKNGCKVWDADTYLDQKAIVYQNKNGVKVPIQILRAYQPNYVSAICCDLGVPPPPSVKKYHEQISYLRYIQGKGPNPKKSILSLFKWFK